MFAKYIFAPVQMTWRDAADLVLPWRHNAYIHRHRASLIISRIQVVAMIFAVLVPLWIIVDALAFERWVWLSIVPVRLVATAIFAALAWPRKINDPVRAAIVMLAVLMAVPPVFYLVSIPIIAQADPAGISGFMRNLYQFLPYTVVAGLSLFPLTGFEVAVCWVGVFLAMIAGELYIHEGTWLTLAGPLWLLMLIGGTAMVSGMSQLQYMIALVRRVTFDSLTGALTRRAGAEILETQYRQSLQNNQPMTIGFIDIDRFKQVNDSFGHEVGDQVLREVSQNLMRGLRQGDTLIRWGGEEFLVVLGGTDKDGARIAVKRLSAAGFGKRPDGTPVTASFGFAERIADDIRDVGDQIELADRRMYEAKLGGRNRAVFAHGDVQFDVIPPENSPPDSTPADS